MSGISSQTKLKTFQGPIKLSRLLGSQGYANAENMGGTVLTLPNPVMLYDKDNNVIKLTQISVTTLQPAVALTMASSIVLITGLDTDIRTMVKGWKPASTVIDMNAILAYTCGCGLTGALGLTTAPAVDTVLYQLHCESFQLGNGAILRTVVT